MQKARLIRLTVLLSFSLLVGANAQTVSNPAAPKRTPSAAGRAIDNYAGPPNVATIDAAGAIQHANAWFNANSSLIGDFVQVGGDGKRSDGKLYVQRPGLMRFAYADPAPLEIIADGTSVAVRNRKLATQDEYFIGQTPLKFLLKDKIDISRDTKVLDVASAGSNVSILIEDKATFGGTSRIKLVFDSKSFSLKQWTVKDPQGYETVVSLSNLDLKTKPSADLFRINRDVFKP